MNLNTLNTLSNTLENTIFFTAYGYCLFYLGATALKGYISPKIKSTDNLEKVIQEEKKRLQINTDIKYKFIRRNEARLERKDEKNYVIGIDNESTISSIYHNMYHIWDGWGEKAAKLGAKDYSFKFGVKSLLLVSEHFLYREPKAIIYQLKRAMETRKTNIKNKN